mgnify:CR=1 FL=1
MGITMATAAFQAQLSDGNAWGRMERGPGYNQALARLERVAEGLGWTLLELIEKARKV